MKKLSLGCFALISVFSLAAAAEQMTGYISDAHCGAKHNKVSAANTKCVKDMCMNGGADPVLVVNDKVMKFDDDSKKKAVPFAGQNVMIDGSMDGDAVKISSIDAAK